MLSGTSHAFLAHFGETVVYRPHAGAARSIKADVNRNLPAPIDELGRSLAASLIVTVRNVATSIDTDDKGCGGITATELLLNRDQIELSRVVGSLAGPRLITAIVEQDEGMLVLKVT